MLLLPQVSDDRHVSLFDCEGKQLVASLSGHASWVMSLDVSPDGLTIATGKFLGCVV